MRIRAKELRQLWKRKEEVYKARTKTTPGTTVEAKAAKPARSAKKGEE
ncbi:hypothetical protein HNQ39_002426 [Armatimonas rosea]|uniref:Uncharacterized protein n=1 Tax=Armatimonas rosea TaxID=685828 RepID=A0A7W9SQL2_ARMRO|nr:hypothetical protein [Armatimonas rosea]